MTERGGGWGGWRDRQRTRDKDKRGVGGGGLLVLGFLPTVNHRGLCNLMRNPAVTVYSIPGQNKGLLYTRSKQTFTPGQNKRLLYTRSKQTFALYQVKQKFTLLGGVVWVYKIGLK